MMHPTRLLVACLFGLLGCAHGAVQQPAAQSAPEAEATSEAPEISGIPCEPLLLPSVRTEPGQERYFVVREGLDESLFAKCSEHGEIKLTCPDGTPARGVELRPAPRDTVRISPPPQLGGTRLYHYYPAGIVRVILDLQCE